MFVLIDNGTVRLPWLLSRFLTAPLKVAARFFTSLEKIKK
jgi:hypothetical protein